MDVLAALYDGPIDLIDFRPIATAIESIPSVGDGATFEILEVLPGDRYVAPESGSVVTATERVEGLGRLVARWTFIEGVTWEDGTPVTAQDSVFSHTLRCDEDTPTSKAVCERTVRYEAIDERTVEWEGLPGYSPPDFATLFVSPLPRQQVGEDGVTRMDLMSAAEVAEDEVFSRHPLAFGPYRLIKWLDGEYIRISPNPHYFRSDEGLPSISMIEFRFIPDHNTLLAGTRIGTYHVAMPSGLSLGSFDFLEEARDAGDLTLHSFDSPIWEHVDFNTDPVDSPRSFGSPFAACEGIRHAIALGTDRQLMIDIVHHGLGTPMESFVPYSHWAEPGPASRDLYRFNPEEAELTLAEMGFIDSDGDGIREASREIICEGMSADGSSTKHVIESGAPLEINLNTSSGSMFREDIALLFQQDMRSLGIRVFIEMMAPSVVYSDGPDGPLFGRRFQLAEFAWSTGTLPAASTYRCSDVPAEENHWNGFNLTGWCDPEFDRVTRLAERTPGFEEAHDLYMQAHERFMSGLPSLPLFQRLQLMATHPELHGVRPVTSASSVLWNIEEWSMKRAE